MLLNSLNNKNHDLHGKTPVVFIRNILECFFNFRVYAHQNSIRFFTNKINCVHSFIVRTFIVDMQNKSCTFICTYNNGVVI